MFLNVLFARLMLSYNGILTISCIQTLTQLALKLSGSIHHVSFLLIQSNHGLLFKHFLIQKYHSLLAAGSCLSTY